MYSTIMMYFAYLFTWDPSRDLFTIPWIGHPVGWYGALFALGFIVAYFIIIGMFTRELLVVPTLTPAHITDWQNLVARLQSASSNSADPLHVIYRTLNKDTCALIDGGHSEDPKLQYAVTDALCKLLSESDLERIAGDFLEPVDRRVALQLGDTKVVRARLTLQRVLAGALATTREVALALTDHLCWFTVVGTIVGARLGQVFFYGWDYYKEHPLEIFMVWHGGLASHGGTIGVMLAIAAFTIMARRRMPQASFWSILDLVAVPTAIVAFCIRLGNFFNQEIIGLPTSMPWAIVFGHPAEGGSPVPRHPVQLYEGMFYLAVFFILYRMWARGAHRGRPGLLVGWFFVLVFGWRILMEYFKVSQGGFAEESLLQTGQLLSIPFVLLGAWLVWRARRRGQAQHRVSSPKPAANH